MPKKQVGRDGPRSGGAEAASDEDIIKERRCRESFDAADKFLGCVSWGLWALAAAWFFFFSAAAPRVPCLHAASGEPAVALAAWGMLAGGISKSSPKATWSTWRLLWHICLCGGSAVLAASFAQAYLALRTGAVSGASASTSPNTAALLMMACGVVAIGAFVTCPKQAPKPAKASDAYLGRIVLVVDGCLGMALGASLLIGCPWGAALGAAATAMSAVPVVNWSMGCLLCRTDAEMVAAVPSAMLYIFASGVLSVTVDGVASAIMTVPLFAVHCMLFLPFPLSDPDSNPFHAGLAKWWRKQMRILSQPVGGFGDDGEGG